MRRRLAVYGCKDPPTTLVVRLRAFSRDLKATACADWTYPQGLQLPVSSRPGAMATPRRSGPDSGLPKRRLRSDLHRILHRLDRCPQFSPVFSRVVPVPHPPTFQRPQSQVPSNSVSQAARSGSRGRAELRYAAGECKAVSQFCTLSNVGARVHLAYHLAAT
jgi:hypothetical protein